MTRADAVAFQSTAVVAAVVNVWGRLRDRRTGRTAADRRRLAHARTADFLRSLDLDPVAVLGVPDDRTGPYETPEPAEPETVPAHPLQPA